MPLLCRFRHEKAKHGTYKTPFIRKNNRLVGFSLTAFAEWTINMTMKYTGLTLIELIVTLAVVSTLLALGVPQFQSTTANSRLTSAVNTLSGDLTFARTEAIKRGVSVKVTGDTNWAQTGWTVAINESGGQNLRISPAIAGGITITTTPANTKTVTFGADGRSTVAVTFKLCDSRTGNLGKSVGLNRSGQIYLQTKQSCP